MKKYVLLYIICSLFCVASLHGQFTKSFNSGMRYSEASRNLLSKPLPVRSNGADGNNIAAPSIQTYRDLLNYIDTSANATGELKDVVQVQKEYIAYYDAAGITSTPGAGIAAAWAEKCRRARDSFQTVKDSVVVHAARSSNPDSMNRLDDSLAIKIKLYQSAKDYFEALNVLEGKPKFWRRWIPLRSIAQARYFYFDRQSDKASINLLSNFALQTDANSKYAVSADIISGILPIVKGVPLKLEIGTTIAQDKDSSSENKAVGKVLYGGLVHASLTYPVLFSNWNYWEGRSMCVYIPLTASLNFDNVDEGSQLLKDAFYFGDVAASLYMKWDLVQSPASDNLASIFINGRFSFVSGGSKFYDNLPGERKSFWTAQINGGIKIMNQYSLAVNFPVWSSNKDLLATQNATVALIIDPNFRKNKK